MWKKCMTVAALTVFLGIAPALAQEETTTPPPSTEQQPAAKPEATKTEEAPQPKRIKHYRYRYHWYNWPGNWIWYHLRYPFHHHHR
jgi:hypothetical protein